MIYSPIALFVYNRPEHTRRAIESLIQCPEFADSLLYVFCDGAKRQEDIDRVMQTRDVVRSLVGAKAEIIEAAKNQGLANSIISGVTRLCNTYKRVIVLEDDLVVMPEFLAFLNAALEKYQNEPSVMQVSGHMFPVPEFINRTEALFLPFTTSWGWGTWKRAWDCFDPEASGWEVLQTDREMRSRFNLDGNFDYFNMLKRQMCGRIDSWAIRWYWSVFKMKGCVLFPPTTYVSNIGFDGSGTHGSRLGRRVLGTGENLRILKPIELPSRVEVNQTDVNAIKKMLKKLNNKWISLIKDIKNNLNFREVKRRCTRWIERRV